MMQADADTAVEGVCLCVCACVRVCRLKMECVNNVVQAMFHTHTAAQTAQWSKKRETFLLTVKSTLKL